MGCKVSSCRGGGMTSSTISVNFNDTAQKTVFTATEKCILKLSAEKVGSSTWADFKLNDTDIGTYLGLTGVFEKVSRSLANLLSPMYMYSNNRCEPTALILYLRKGDTVYATRQTGSEAFTLTLYSAVFTF